MIQPEEVSANLTLADGLCEPAPFRLAGLSGPLDPDCGRRILSRRP